MSKESAIAMITALPTATSTSGGSPGLQPAEGAGAPKQELDSTRFAHLAKKETELQRQRESFKKEQETFASEREKVQSIQKKFSDIEQAKTRDVVQAMRLAGFTEQDFYNYLAAQEDTSTPEERASKAAQTEIQKFKDEQTKAAADAQQTRGNEAVDNFKTNVSKLLTSDKDKYEYCNHNGPLAEDLIFETLSAVYDAEGEIISAAEAADMVELYYEEADKAMNTLKKRGYKAPEAAVVPVKEEPLRAEVSARPASKTLSNRTSATVASTVVQRRETRSEKRERLITALSNMGKA